MAVRRAQLALLILCACGGDDAASAAGLGARVPADPRLDPWLGTWTAEGQPFLSIVDGGTDGVRIIPVANETWSVRVEEAHFDGSALRFDLYFDCRTMDHPYSGVRNEVCLVLGSEPGTLVSKLRVDGIGYSPDAVLRRSR